MSVLAEASRCLELLSAVDTAAQGYEKGRLAALPRAHEGDARARPSRASEVGLVLAPQGLGGQAPATAGLPSRSEPAAGWLNCIRGKACEQGFRIIQG